MTKSGLFFISLSFLAVFGTVAHAQEVWELWGRVQDKQGRPLEQALVYLEVESRQGIYQFSTTGIDGSFQFLIDTTWQKVLLHVKYLGKKDISREITRGEDNKRLIFTLEPQEQLLAELLVKEKRPPITGSQSDTVVYNVDAFRDSSEFTVEELLHKLPGVEVLETGEIKIEGKPIQKVLIEGDDLFGRKYTIGTKNIRAHYIDKVEVIKRFQDNPVLRDINSSNEVAINLVLKKEKRDITNAAVFAGVGYGQEWKQELKANVFSISKNRKHLLVTDMGNVGNHFGAGELAVTFSNFDGNSIENEWRRGEDLVEFPSIQTLGMPPKYLDNSKNYFGTLRSLQNITNNWKIGVNFIGNSKNDRHSGTYSQYFTLLDQPYELNQQERLTISDKLAEAELTVNHIPKHNRRSLFSYFKWSRNDKNWLNNRLYYDPHRSYSQDIAGGTSGINLYGAALFSEKLGDFGVLQAQARVQATDRYFRNNFQNRDFPLFFGIDTAAFLLEQRLNNLINGTEYKIKVLKRIGTVILELGSRMNSNKASIDRTWLLQEEGGKNVNFSGESQLTETLKTIELEHDMKVFGAIPHFANFEINVGLFSGILRKMDRDESVSKIKFPLLRFGLERTMRKDQKLKFQYRFAAETPSIQHYFSTNYVLDNFTLVSSNLPYLQPLSGHHFLLHYQKNNPIKLYNAYVQLRYSYRPNYLETGTSYERSLMYWNPLILHGSQTIQLSGRYDFFIAGLKTGFEINPSITALNESKMVEEKQIELGSNIAQIKAVIRTVLFQKIRFNTSSHYSWFIAKNRESKLTIQNFREWRTNMDAFVRWHSGQIGMVYDHIGGRSFFSTTKKMSGLSCYFSKDAKLFQKQATIKFQLHNLLNKNNFSAITANDGWQYFSTVEAIPIFGTLHVDINLGM